MIRAVTLDCWGTLFLDGPASDDRYKRRAWSGCRRCWPVPASPWRRTELDRAYAAVGHWLGRLWQMNGDVVGPRARRGPAQGARCRPARAGERRDHGRPDPRLCRSGPAWRRRRLTRALASRSNRSPPTATRSPSSRTPCARRARWCDRCSTVGASAALPGADLLRRVRDQEARSGDLPAHARSAGRTRRARGARGRRRGARCRGRARCRDGRDPGRGRTGGPRPR